MQRKRRGYVPDIIHLRASRLGHSPAGIGGERFKITTGAESQYYLASVIGILVFVVVAVISLIVYSLLPSTRNEEDFQ